MNTFQSSRSHPRISTPPAGLEGRNGMDLAVFCATSPHSGVNRLFSNLLPAMASAGVTIDLLKIRNHGPYLHKLHPNIRTLELPVSHVLSCAPHLVKYLKRVRPGTILTDKDRVNRTCIVATRLAKFSGRVMLRLGTTVSTNLHSRGVVDRSIQLLSMRRLYPHADGIIFPSRGAAQDFASITGMPEDRFWVIPNPILTDDILDSARLPASHPWLAHKEGTRIIAAFGELCARKDFETLIRAFVKVQKDIPSRLVIFGEGRRRARLEELIHRLELNGQVSLPGFVSNPFAEMAKADLVVLSSKWEGFGNVLAEAMALGVPVVSTDCPSGPREILEDGRYGPLVPVGDPERLADAIRRTLRSAPSPQELRRAAERYHVHHCATRYMTALGIKTRRGATGMRDA
ncbi:Glycosyltransferase involved in cell wall bisynthesis [Desulfacinum hydrothermale DSM 13146]|uniref:Glycosyltransferase involved in cell wall bisynthesis n=1 Tax=Desulfacinum hydrothermale DSM 13146 TaxID=1121390 RepID=A0A1W1X2I7_9BACT|nr:glycosyltransferase [Desulfacinum hydrothermale]SMC17621.1 Glycosyltransferase involved in cell wall bisynthesis [Desulfacinum hydrothermale DSM 13146]